MSFFRALFDKQTPAGVKVFLIIAALYAVLPFDFVPDMIPLLGVLDDLLLIITAIVTFWQKTKKVRERLRRSSSS